MSAAIIEQAFKGQKPLTGLTLTLDINSTPIGVIVAKIHRKLDESEMPEMADELMREISGAATDESLLLKCAKYVKVEHNGASPIAAKAKEAGSLFSLAMGNIYSFVARLVVRAFKFIAGFLLGFLEILPLLIVPGFIVSLFGLIIWGVFTANGNKTNFEAYKNTLYEFEYSEEIVEGPIRTFKRDDLNLDLSYGYLYSETKGVPAFLIPVPDEETCQNFNSYIGGGIDRTIYLPKNPKFLPENQVSFCATLDDGTMYAVRRVDIHKDQ